MVDRMLMRHDSRGQPFQVLKVRVGMGPLEVGRIERDVPRPNRRMRHARHRITKPLDLDGLRCRVRREAKEIDHLAGWFSLGGLHNLAPLAVLVLIDTLGRHHRE